MAEWKSYHFKCLSLNGSVSAQFYKYLKAFLPAQGWEKVDEWGGQAAQFYLTGNNYFNNNETVTIDGKVYTFKTALTQTEGEVLIGANLAASYDNFKLAINRTDPGTNDGVKYKIAEAHPLWEATTNADTAQWISWRAGVGNSAGNVPVFSETCQYQSWSGIAVWGIDQETCWKSNGESGLESYGYIAIQHDSTAVTLRFMAYQYWNTTTHTGTRRASTNDNFYLSAFTTALECIISGDKDLIYINNNCPSRDNYSGWMVTFGHIPKRFMPTLIATTGDVVAGSEVSIPVTDSSVLPGTGGFFQILGLSEGCDKLQVSSIPDSTHVVVVTLPRNYASGAKIGFPASTFFINNSYINQGHQVPWPVSYFSDVGLTVAGTGRYTFTAIDIRSQNLFYGKRVMTPMFCMQDTLAAIGWIDKGMFFYAGVTSWDVACANNDGSIIITNILATSGANLSITDSTKSWTPDALIGKYIVVVGGTGIGQVRKITDNDATSLTINYAWYTNPDATTTFRIYDSIYRYLSNSPWTTTALLVTHTELPPLS